MARHAIIEADIYEDLFEEGFSVDSIYIYIWYVITCKNLLGLYRTRYSIDRVSMGYPPKKFEKAKEKLEKFGKIFWEDGWVWIVGKAKKISGPKQTASAYKLLKEIPDTVKLKQKLLEKYDTLSMGYPPLDSNALPKPKPKPKERITSSCSRNSKPEFLERVEKLKSLILQNNPKAKPKTTNWVNTVRLMVERDSRTLGEIDEIIGFSQQDDFWKGVILSMGNLREKFDKLTMKMKGSKHGASKKTNPSSPERFTKTGFSEIPEPKN